MSIAGSNTLEADYEKLTNEALQQRERIVQLEQLCRDMYAQMSKSIGTLSAADADAFDETWTQRMEQLDLLDGE